MPAKKRKRKSINLLPKDEFESSTAGRILKWALTTLRMIVISIEIVVVGGFLMRFWLDADNADLDHSIEQKKVLIESFADFEKDFRLVQTKLALFKNYTLEQNNKLPLFQLVISKLPNDLQMTSIATIDGGIEIMGISDSENSISQFITNLQADEKFDSVTLTEIGTKRDTPFVEFSLKVSIKMQSQNGET